eukprot:5858885-Ditylum_brightwellii.AAC.1
MQERAYFMDSQGGQRLSTCIYDHMHFGWQSMSAIRFWIRLMAHVHSQDFQGVQSKRALRTNTQHFAQSTFSRHPCRINKDIPNGIRVQDWALIWYNDFFESVHPGTAHLPVTSKWQELSGFSSSTKRSAFAKGVRSVIHQTA